MNNNKNCSDLQTCQTDDMPSTDKNKTKNKRSTEYFYGKEAKRYFTKKSKQ